MADATTNGAKSAVENSSSTKEVLTAGLSGFITVAGNGAAILFSLYGMYRLFRD